MGGDTSRLSAQTPWPPFASLRPSRLSFLAPGKYLQGVTRGLDLVFFDVSSGKPLPTPALVRDSAWASLTTPVGFNVQGMWPTLQEGELEVSRKQAGAGATFRAPLPYLLKKQSINAGG